QMVEACRRSKVRLMTAYRKYFEPATVDLKRLIVSKKLGPLKLIHSAFTFHLPDDQAWHLRRELAAADPCGTWAVTASTQFVGSLARSLSRPLLTPGLRTPPASARWKRASSFN